jgi:hypothetical protein
VDDLRDWIGRSVRCPSERLGHILIQAGRPGIEQHIRLALVAPDFVVRSKSDAAVMLYYRIHHGEEVGTKWVCVVVKYGAKDAFLLTAYYTDRMKSGEHVQPEASP